MKWYLHHFPSATSFLASGALMTGEASPGYLPYPDVVRKIANVMPGPRIVVVGREPIDRAYSSYRYNYATPTIEEMKKGRWAHIETGMSVDYYTTFLFTFEEMVRAELNVLTECFDLKNGSGVVGANQDWSKTSAFKAEFKRRSQNNLPPLVDLDGHCYGDVLKEPVIKRQWSELVANNPQKVFSPSNVHLKQSLIGRSLYVFPLEWWYARFKASDIYFVCTEEMHDFSGRSMGRLADFLGLPSYNFSTVVKGGAFNVGGHRGYDTELAWNEIESGNEAIIIPLADEFRAKLIDFVRPYNDRLFELVGRRCDW
jgi:hypothetical protein